MKRAPTTEAHVKALVKDWYDAREAWHYAPIQNGMGVHGIPDRIGCVPIVVTQAMVGKTIGLFVAIEAKKPGRRGEKLGGLSAHQLQHLNAISLKGGLATRCDGGEDLYELDDSLSQLREGLLDPGGPA